MTTNQLISLLTFTLDRFSGFVPEEKMLRNAINDWERLK